MLVGAQTALAQRRVTGTVSAEVTGAPIADVTVLVQGTMTGAQTGSDGRFVLAQAPSAAFTLVARRIGFTQATINVGTDSNDVHVTLVQDALRRDEGDEESHPARVSLGLAELLGQTRPYGLQGRTWGHDGDDAEDGGQGHDAADDQPGARPEDLGEPAEQRRADR